MHPARRSATYLLRVRSRRLRASILRPCFAAMLCGHIYGHGEFAMYFGFGDFESVLKTGPAWGVSLKSLCLGAVLSAGGYSSAWAQSAAESKPDTVKPVLITTPHAPIARQVEPMVAPVRRVAPGAAVASTPKPAATVAAAAVPAKLPSGLQPASGASLAPSSTGTAANSKSKGPVAAVATAPSTGAPTAATVAVPARITPTVKLPKFVAYTCKLGEDYSVARKTCFTPGVKAAGAVKSASASKTANSQPPKAAIESSGRSALGVKP